MSGTVKVLICGKMYARTHSFLSFSKLYRQQIQGLISEKMTGKAILTEDNTAIGSIHREDVAQLVVRCLSADASKKILTAIDPTLRSAVAGEEKSHAEFELN